MMDDRKNEKFEKRKNDEKEDPNPVSYATEPFNSLSIDELSFSRDPEILKKTVFNKINENESSENEKIQNEFYSLIYNVDTDLKEKFEIEENLEIEEDDLELFEKFINSLEPENFFQLHFVNKVLLRNYDKKNNDIYIKIMEDLLLKLKYTLQIPIIKKFLINEKLDNLEKISIMEFFTKFLADSLQLNFLEEPDYNLYYDSESSNKFFDIYRDAFFKSLTVLILNYYQNKKILENITEILNDQKLKNVFLHQLNLESKPEFYIKFDIDFTDSVPLEARSLIKAHREIHFKGKRIDEFFKESIKITNTRSLALLQYSNYLMQSGSVKESILRYFQFLKYKNELNHLIPILKRYEIDPIKEEKFLWNSYFRIKKFIDNKNSLFEEICEILLEHADDNDWTKLLLVKLNMEYGHFIKASHLSQQFIKNISSNSVEFNYLLSPFLQNNDKINVSIALDTLKIADFDEKLQKYILKYLLETKDFAILENFHERKHFALNTDQYTLNWIDEIVVEKAISAIYFFQHKEFTNAYYCVTGCLILSNLANDLLTSEILELLSHPYLFEILKITSGKLTYDEIKQNYDSLKK